MRLGIYVGSFNPVHKGHKVIMDYLLDNNYVDKIIVVATGNYWDKKDLIDINDRINMLKFYENEKIIINTNLNNLQYTYQILEHLKIVYPEDNLYLIIGADNIPKFNLWEKVDMILKNKVFVLNRDNINIKKYIEKFKQKDNFIIVSGYVQNNTSSTLIRILIKSGKLEKIYQYLDKDILDYILKNNLYEVTYGRK